MGRIELIYRGLGRARDRGHQQGRRGRPARPRAAPARGAALGRGQREDRRGHRRRAGAGRGRAAPARRGVQGAAALRARRPDQPVAPAWRDRLDGAHRRRHHRRRPGQRGPRRRAGVVRRLTSGSPLTSHSRCQGVPGMTPE